MLNEIQGGSYQFRIIISRIFHHQTVSHTKCNITSVWDRNYRIKSKVVEKLTKIQIREVLEFKEYSDIKRGLNGSIKFCEGNYVQHITTIMTVYK